MPRSLRGELVMTDRPDVPAEVRPLLGLPSLTRYDDPSGYDALLAWVAEDVQPHGAAEWMWVKEVTDLAWEALRLRRAHAQAIEDSRRRAEKTFTDAAYHEALRKGPRPTREQVRGLEPMPDWWPPRVELVEHDVAVKALEIGLAPWERLDRLIARTELRRERVLFAIERWRALLATRLRAATEPAVIDAWLAAPAPETEAAA
jgi:hypothetical protein